MAEQQRIEGWQHPIAFYRIEAGAVEPFTAPFLFLPVKLGWLPFIRGAFNYWSEQRKYTGTAQEIDEAVQSALEQELVDALTVQEVAAQYGATFRVLDGTTLEVAEQEQEVPPPWEFRLVNAPGGAILEFRSKQ